MAANGVLDRGLKIRPMVLPDLFLDQYKPERQYDNTGLLSPHILATALDAFEPVPTGRILGIPKELAQL